MSLLKLYWCQQLKESTGHFDYAVKTQTSLAPLSRFRGSRVTTAHAHQCCRFQSHAKTVPSRMKYAVKVQRSLAPLSWFPGSRKPTAHVHQCCRFQSYAKSRRLHAIANDIYKQNLHCVNHIPGIHDNGPPRTTLWRLTLTAYWQGNWQSVNQHSWDPRQRTTWSRRVTSDFNSVFHVYSVNKRMFLTTAKLAGACPTYAELIPATAITFKKHARMKWLITRLQQKEHPLIWIHYESGLLGRTGTGKLITIALNAPDIYTHEWNKHKFEYFGNGLNRIFHSQMRQCSSFIKWFSSVQ